MEEYYNNALVEVEKEYGKAFRDIFAKRVIGLEEGVIQAKEDIDIDYERALEIYKIAKERQDESQKSKKVIVAVLDS